MRVIRKSDGIVIDYIADHKLDESTTMVSRFLRREKSPAVGNTGLRSLIEQWRLREQGIEGF